MIFLPDGSIYDGPATPDAPPRSAYEEKFERLFEETFAQRFASPWDDGEEDYAQEIGE